MPVPGLLRERRKGEYREDCQPVIVYAAVNRHQLLPSPTTEERGKEGARGAERGGIG